MSEAVLIPLGLGQLSANSGAVKTVRLFIKVLVGQNVALVKSLTQNFVVLKSGSSFEQII
jgi:hypothetical protein